MPNVVFESGFPLHRYGVQWKIRYFSAYFNPVANFDDFKTESPEFSTNSGHKWKLQIFKDDGETGCSITLVSEERETNVQIEASFIIDGHKHRIKRTTVPRLSTNSKITLWKMISKDLWSLAAKTDEVCINLEIEEWTEKTITVANSSCDTTAEHLSITNKITKFLTDQALTDVTLECEGKKFEAHKLILAAASPVFKAMFKEGTKEHRDNYVNIQDIDSDVFDVFLRFLYSGQVDQLDEMFLDLFTAADKYDVQPLREICIRHMASNISVDNALGVLALAERHSIEETKSLVLQFIKTNFADVLKPNSWSSLLAIHLLFDRKRLGDKTSTGEGSARKRKK